jgi:hypothetical protein
MRKIILPIFLLISIIGYSQFITIDESLTVQQLVEDILIDSPCAQTSNYGSRTGLDYGEGNGIAAFNGNNSNFPYKTGIILSSGFVSNAPGPNQQDNSNGSNNWLGDDDLEIYTSTNNSNNASFIQFDFVPRISQISFNFIFASEELNQNFECFYSDAFAFILTDQVTGTVQNLAILPGTDIPIEATNIHPDVPGGCPAINEEFFDRYNFSPFNDPNTAAIDFNGQTISLVAQGNVIIDNTYTIKLVIADDSDTAYDSAVFFEGGSFNINVDLGEDLLIIAGNAPCQGESQEIGVNPDPLEETTYQWYVLNEFTMVFDLIAGEISNTIIVIESGTYKIETILSIGCLASDDIVVEFSPLPIPGIPDDLALCDEIPNDGFAAFDLTLRDAQIINFQLNTFVTYYVTEVGAEAGSFPINFPTAYTNTTPDSQTVFARLERTTGGCFDIVPLFLQVDAAAAITDPISDYFICDNDQDGIEIFDLSSKAVEILNTLVDVTLIYYNSQGDADSDTNPIANPSSYSSGGETIWVRASNTDGCIAVSSFELVLGTVPVFVEVPLFALCDDLVVDGLTAFDLNTQNVTIINGDTNLSVTYYGTQADADTGDNPLTIPYTNTVNFETIYVRVEDTTTGCYGSFEMVLEVVSVTGVVPDDLILCDEIPNDGFAAFDLTLRDAQIINSQPSTFVTYYQTEADAEAGSNALTIPYTNTTPDSQTVFARLEETRLGCFDIVPLLLQVDAAPAITDPISDYFICDNDQDGIEIFDLSSKEVEILNGLDPNLYSIAYYEDINLTIAISNPESYPNIPPSPQTIYILVEDLANGCQSQTTLLLVVNPLPVLIAPVPLELCDATDITGPDDELEPFNLESKTDEIRDGDANINITYYQNQADADTGDNPLVSPYINTSNPQTIFIRAENTTTFCVESRGTTLELLVNPLPSPITPTPLEVCDENNDGFVAFDLTSKDTEIIGGETGVVISYYQTQADAESGTNPLASPYTNIETPSQIVYVRAEFTTTGCYRLVSMELITNPTPEIPTDLEDIAICDINLDGIEIFDLTQRAGDIYGSQDPLDYSLSYYTSQGDADLATNAIANPAAFLNTSSPQTIWVRLVNNLTTCFSIGNFVIDFIFCPLPDATIVISNIGVFCSDSNLDVEYTVFNLNSTGPLPANTPIAFYANGILIGQSQTINEIPIDGSELAIISLFIPGGTPFIFTLKGVVDDNGTGIGIVGEENETNNEFEIEIDLNGETIDLGPAIESCIGYTIVLDADLGDPSFTYQWFFNDVLIPDATDPLFSLTETGTYRVDAVEGACFVTGEVFVNFNAPPIAVVPDDLAVCDQVPNDGFAEFDLTLRDTQIIGGQPDTFVSYYETDADADTSTNPLTSPYTNTTSETQVIFARLEEITVGCYDVVEMVLRVDAAPAITDPISQYFICDNDQDGIEVFDLTAKNQEILNTLVEVTLTYYNTQGDADLDTNSIATPSSYTSSGVEVIWVRAENPAGCITVAPFDLVLGTVPLYVEVPLFPLCDDVISDGFTEFNLNTQNATIVAGDTNLRVTYYGNQADGELAENPLVIPYTNIVNPEIVYVRVENTTTGCYGLFEMLLDVVSPIAVVPDDLALCDQVPNDGFEEFDLTLRDTQIIDGQPDTFVSYYETEVDAEFGTNSINPSTSYTNIIESYQVIFARLEETRLGCYDVVPMVLRVDIAPAITDPISDYFICDNDQDGIEIFDLTAKNQEILNTLVGVFLNYYNTESDAIDDTNAIVSPSSYTSSGEVIWVRAENSASCITVAPFDLVLGRVPLYVEVPLFALCDDAVVDGFTEFDLNTQNATIVAGDTNLSVTYYGTQADAEFPESPLTSPYTNTVNPETVYVRVEDNTTGCYGLFEMLLDVVSPTAVVPDDLAVCDQVPNDGFAEFDLTLRDTQIIDGQSDTFVSYYETEIDAESGTNPIDPSTAYTNIIESYQIIFARLQETLLGCYDVVEMVLRVDAAPAITDPISDYFICDNDQDGIEIFDLTSKNQEILNTLVDVSLIYYTTEADAIDDVNSIVTPSSYTSGGEIIWVRAENSASCITVAPFNLVLATVPLYDAVPVFALCDDVILDGFTEFDLNTQNATIIAGNTDLSVTYYGTQADADLADNPLLIPYTNTVNPEIIYVRVEDNLEGCYGVFAMELQVISPPDIFEPSALEYCDPDNDGFGEFTLTDADLAVTGGVPTGNLVVSYHYLLEDAQNDVNPLASPYFNDVPFSQTLYVRLFDQSTGCYSITTLELLVLDSPQIIMPSDLFMCDDNEDGIVFFDLTQVEDELLNGLDPDLYSITYYENINLTIAITNADNYPTIPPSPQTIYALVADLANGCQSQTTFLLWVNLPPVLIAPVPLELCDATDITGPDDELEPFNLESKTDEIRDGNVNINITYYQTQADADTGDNPLVSPYINTSNPQTIFIRAEDVTTFCVESRGTTLDLLVNPLPSPITPTPLEVCDDNDDGFAEFDLTSKDTEILGGETGVVISYYQSLLDAESGTNPLASPYTNIASPSQIVYVRAEYTIPATGCYRLVPMELIVYPTPDIPIDLDDLVACDSDQDGIEVFDLTQRAGDIYGSQDPLDYSLSYYISQVDADLATNAIANPAAFSNTSSPQTIWVRLVNDLTTCFSIGSFDLVLQGPPGFTEVPVFALCDDLIEDGFTEFDLNTQNATIVAGNTDLSVTYYGTQADADLAQSPLLSPYTNTVNPEIIYVRVDDNVEGCYGVFEMELQVISPIAIVPDPLEYCDPDNDGFGEFTLTDADSQITGGNPSGNLQVTYHYL